MLKRTAMMIVAMAALTGAALSAEEKKLDEIDQSILELEGMLKSRTPDIEAMVAAVKELGRKGPAAQKAVPVLLDCLGRTGPIKEATSGPIKHAATEALLKMGPAAIGPTVETLEAALADAMTMKQGILNPKALSYIKLLRKMDAAFKGNKVISALEAPMPERAKASQKAAIEQEKAAPWSEQLKNATAAKEKAYFQWQMLVDAMAMLGEKSIPALTKALSEDFHEDILALKIGPAALQAAGRMIERHEEDGRDWPFYYSLALAVEPDKELCKPLIDRMAKDEHCMVNYIGMVLDRMAPASIQPVAAMLADKEGDWYVRWAAAKTLELMGPKAKEAVPALEKTLADEEEDINVRVGAARAIARIMGTDPFERYKQIPDVEKRILETCKEKSLAWRQAYMKRKTAENGDRRPANFIAWWVYCLCSGQYLDAANADMKRKAEVGPGAVGSFSDVDWVRVFVMCHSKSKFFPGRLKYADNKVEYTGPNSAKLEFFCITQEAYEAGKVKEKEYNAKVAPARREASGRLWKEIDAKLKIEGKQRQEHHIEYVGAKSIEMAEKALGIKPFSPGYALPKINGKTIDLDMKYNYRSPYLESKVGSDIVTVRYGSRRWEYDFGKSTITEIKK